MIKYRTRLTEKSHHSGVANVYLVRTIPGKIEEPVIPPVEVVPDDNDIMDFDFAVLRYRWGESAGKDLDTRTFIKTPNRSENIVGWDKLDNDLNYLIWNDDNLGNGVESVLIDLKSIITDHPNESIIEISISAFWYSLVRSGDLRIEFVSYKDGAMVPDGFDWINIGGTQVQTLFVDSNTQLLEFNKDTPGQPIALFTFNNDTKTGSITPMRDTSHVHVPEVDHIPLEFIISSDDTIYGDTKVVLTLYDVVGDWWLYEDDLLVASDYRLRSDNTIVFTSNTNRIIYISNLRNSEKQYKLYASAEGVGLERQVLQTLSAETAALQSITKRTI